MSLLKVAYFIKSNSTPHPPVYICRWGEGGDKVGDVEQRRHVRTALGVYLLCYLYDLTTLQARVCLQLKKTKPN